MWYFINRHFKSGIKTPQQTLESGDKMDAGILCWQLIYTSWLINILQWTHPSLRSFASAAQAVTNCPKLVEVCNWWSRMFILQLSLKITEYFDTFWCLHIHIYRLQSLHYLLNIWKHKNNLQWKYEPSSFFTDCKQNMTGDNRLSYVTILES